jgi:hypothetical protein
MKHQYQRNQAAKATLAQSVTATTLTPLEKFTALVQTSMAAILLTSVPATGAEDWVSTSIHQRQKQGAYHAKIKEANTRSSVNFRCKKAA